ncbi:hypothetical protein PFISCL1PPCAC_7522, partial [Pristionchus fissidentatus]
NLHLNVDEYAVIEVFQRLVFLVRICFRQLLVFHHLPSGRWLILPRVVVSHDSGMLQVSHKIYFTQCLRQLVFSMRNVHPLYRIFFLVGKVLSLKHDSERSLSEMTIELEVCQKPGCEIVVRLHGFILLLSREERAQLLIQSSQHREV